MFVRNCANVNKDHFKTMCLGLKMNKMKVWCSQPCIPVTQKTCAEKRNKDIFCDFWQSWQHHTPKPNSAIGMWCVAPGRGDGKAGSLHLGCQWSGVTIAYGVHKTQRVSLETVQRLTHQHHGMLQERFEAVRLNCTFNVHVHLHNNLSGHLRICTTQPFTQFYTRAIKRVRITAVWKSSSARYFVQFKYHQQHQPSGPMLSGHVQRQLSL